MAAAAKQTATVDILQAFTNATPDDLEQVRARRDELQKQIDSLDAIERALDVRINGKKPRQVKGKKGAGGGANSTPSGVAANAAFDDFALKEKRHKIIAYLRAKGMKSKTKMSEDLGFAFVGRNNLHLLLACDLFHVNADGMVSLSAKGEREVILAN